MADRNGGEGEAASEVRRSRGVLPKFKGGETDDVRRFIARVDAHKTQMKLDDKQTAEAVSECLDGRAWDWYDNVTQEKVAGRDVWTAEAGGACLRKLLMERYAKELTPAQIAKAMHELKMEAGESVDDFLDRCKKLQFRIEGPDCPREGDNKAGYDIMHEAAIKTMFLNGLTTELKNVTLTTAKGHKLGEYVVAARTAEASVKQVRNINELSFGEEETDEPLPMPTAQEVAWMYQTFRGRGRGRGGRGRGGRGASGGRPGGNGGDNNGRNRGGGNSTPRENDGPCFKCWDFGHVRKDCPNKQRPCPWKKSSVNSVETDNGSKEQNSSSAQDFLTPMPW